MITVCNTSPISNLIQIDALPLLGQLFTQITIPPEVAEELNAGAEVLGVWREAPSAAVIEVVSVANTDLERFAVAFTRGVHPSTGSG